MYFELDLSKNSLYIFMCRNPILEILFLYIYLLLIGLSNYLDILFLGNGNPDHQRDGVFRHNWALSSERHGQDVQLCQYIGVIIHWLLRFCVFRQERNLISRGMTSTFSFVGVCWRYFDGIWLIFNWPMTINNSKLGSQKYAWRLKSEQHQKKIIDWPANHSSFEATRRE